MKFLAPAALAIAPVLALAIPQPAAAQGYMPNRIVTSFDEQTLVQAAGELNATVQKVRQGEVEAYAITFQGNVKALAYLYACENGTACGGLRMVALMERPEGMDDAAFVSALEDRNRQQRLAKFYRTPAGKAVAERYLVADGGIAMANVRTEMALFRNQILQFARALYPAAAE